MRGRIGLHQPRLIDAGIDLGRGEGGVAEQLLDRAQVGAALEQVRGVGVTEPVRVADEAAQRARVQAAPPHREEERVARPAREPGSAFRTSGASSHGAAAALANFAPNSPKEQSCARRSIRPNAAASQNAVEPPLPSTTSYPSGSE